MTKDSDDRRRLRIALAANVAMFFVGLAGWYFADSTSLLADAFDMLADASGYVFAMFAIGRSSSFKRNAARWNGAMLVLLGVVVIAEVIDRFLNGSAPLGLLIAGFAIMSLTVNGSVLKMLSRYRDASDVHLRATWVDTRADVIVNMGVLSSGVAIAITGIQKIDLIVGAAIGIYVIKEGCEIWFDAGGDD